MQDNPGVRIVDVASGGCVHLADEGPKRNHSLVAAVARATPKALPHQCEMLTRG